VDFVFFQFDLSELIPFLPLIYIILLIGGLTLFLRAPFYFLLKGGNKTDFKWIAISVLIQFGMIMLISTPVILNSFVTHGPPHIGLILLVVITSFFIDLNLVNTIHQVGIKKSIFVALIVIIPTSLVMNISIPLLMTMMYSL
jgi:hypothetical protein